MKRLTLLLTCFFIGMGLAIAQNVQVSGTVVDEAGEPVIGARVVLKGSPTVGTVTGVDGEFNLAISSASDKLVVSYMGMQSQEIGAGTNLRIVLHQAISDLDEVVVVAYRSAKKTSLTGSVNIVKSDQLSRVSTNSVDQALQGKAAGVQVTASTGRPGSGANIKIRGTSSISAGNNPLYVVDGVPVSSTDFATMNSNDIEYMSILKDASATALYGSRGSNGVVLITTKKGKDGKAVFNVKAMFGISTRTLSESSFTMMNAQEKLTYERQLGSGKGATMTDAQIAEATNTYWPDEVFRTGFTNSYEVNMSGGTETTKYYVSGQYFDQEAIVPGSYLTRGTFRANLENTINDRLKVAVLTSAGVSKEGILRTDRNALNPFNYIYNANPYDAPYNKDGSFNTGISVGGIPLNIFENIENNPRHLTTIKEIGIATLEWKIWDELKFNTMASMDFTQQRNYQYNKPESQLSQILGSPYGYRNESVAQRATWMWANLLSYEKTFADVHEVKAILGTEAQSSNYRNLAALVSGYPTGKLDAIDIGSTDKDVEGVETEWKQMSYFGMFGYTYDLKYIVDLAIRRDGSSRFGISSKYGTFWAVGLGWNMEQESFLSDIDWINRFKIRGSTGTSGNNDIGNYAAQGVYGYGSYNGASTAFPARLPNPDLSWEKSTQTSVGFDGQFFNSRLNATFDIYHRKTTDLLLSTRLSMTSGFGSRIDNVGELVNKGYEFAIDGDIIRNGDWTVNLNFMISQNKNEIVKLYKGNDIGVGWNNIIKEGYPINSYKMVRWAGVNPANGDALFYTADGKITNVYDSNDAVVLDNKSPDPKYFGSFGASAKYKGLELVADFYFSGGNYIYNHIRFFAENDGASTGSNLDKSLLYDQWLKPGDITNVPRQSTSSSQVQSTRYLEDGSYLRLRNVTLGYTMPKKTLAPIGLQNCRVFAQALNLFTVTKFKGLDPEVGTSPYGTGTGAVGGVLDYSYPASRTIMFGIEVGF